MLERCPACEVKKLRTEAERARQLCDECLPKVVRAPALPDLRKPVPCRGCGHTRFARTALYDSDGARPVGRLGVGSGFEVRAGWIKVVSEILPAPHLAQASLFAYVCRGCGLTELYTDGFADLPIGPQHGTDLIDVAPADPDGPFR